VDEIQSIQRVLLFNEKPRGQIE